MPSEKKLQQALDDVQMTYEELVEIADSITKPLFEASDTLVNSISTSTMSTSLDAIRDMLIQLSIQSYSLADIKEKSSLKEECAETLRKFKYAQEFNGLDGSVAYRENNAMLNSSEQTLTGLVFNLVASSLKTKVDELHRFIDTLKSILMSRMQEMKMSSSISVGEQGEKTYLTE